MEYYMYARQSVKKSTEPGAVPTINSATTDHTQGSWTIYDIKDGEFFANTSDKRLFIRLGDEIKEIYSSGQTMNFVNLGDVPISYSGNYGKILSVNSAETALEYITYNSGNTDFNYLNFALVSASTITIPDNSGYTKLFYNIDDGELSEMFYDGTYSPLLTRNNVVNLTGDQTIFDNKTFVDNVIIQTGLDVQGSLSGVSLNDLDDVETTPIENDLLVYSGGSWINASVSDLLAVTTGVSNMTDIGDVSATTLATGDILVYDDVELKWINTPANLLPIDLSNYYNITEVYNTGETYTKTEVYNTGETYSKIEIDNLLTGSTSTGATLPGGSDFSVQFNSGGTLAGDSVLTYDYETPQLALYYNMGSNIYLRAWDDDNIQFGLNTLSAETTINKDGISTTGTLKQGKSISTLSDYSHAGGVDAVSNNYGEITRSGGKFDTSGDCQYGTFSYAGKSSEIGITNLSIANQDYAKNFKILENHTYSFTFFPTIFDFNRKESANFFDVCANIPLTITNSAGTLNVIDYTGFLYKTDIYPGNGSVNLTSNYYFNIDTSSDELIIKVSPAQLGDDVRWNFRVDYIEMG